MATRGIRPIRDDSLLRGWQPMPETAPSVLREEKPTFSRILAAIGLFFILVGGLALLETKTREWFGRGYIMGAGWGFFFFSLGIAGLLQHAYADKDLQFRRLYSVLGLLLAAVGAAAAILPGAGGMGTYFVPVGVPGLFVGLLFLLGTIRNETELAFKNLLLSLVAALGAAMIVVGLVGGILSQSFLLAFGVHLLLLGLLYGGAFMGLHEGGEDRNYQAGLALGVAGAVAFGIALFRSLAPVFAENAPHYFVPSGFLLTSIGFVFICVSLGVCSDRPLVVMTRRELTSMFHSPIAYLLMVAIVILSAFMFWLFVSQISRPRPEPIVRSYIFSLIPVVLQLFSVPIITMRLVSEEKRTGTMEMLLTAPVQEGSVLFSKFLAAWTFYLLTWAPMFLFLIALRGFTGEEFDYRPLLSFGLALLATSAGFIAMGLFFSSLTSNQIIAAVFTFVGMIAHLATHFVPHMAQFSPGSVLTEIFEYVSFLDLWWSTLGGFFAPRILLFHVSLAVVFLYLTHKVLEARKWK